MNLKSKKLKEIAVRLRAVLRSSKGRDAMLFLLFVCISGLFWLMLTLDDEMQHDIDLPLVIKDVPPEVTFISNVPSTVQVSLRDRGTSLIEYVWGSTPTISVSYDKLHRDKHTNRITMSAAELTAAVRSVIASGSRIQSLRPDSLSIVYTTRPGRKMPVSAVVDVTPSLQCVISGKVKVEPESVMVYSAHPLPHTLKAIPTNTLSRSEAADTVIANVSLRHIDGVRFLPESVTITVPVEPLITKHRSVGINVMNAPAGVSVITFPSQVNVTYLVAMSLYNRENGTFSVKADYSRRSSSGRMPLTITSTPEFANSPSLDVDSVEFIVEQSPVQTK
jgi:hypothetical protein